MNLPWLDDGGGLEFVFGEAEASRSVLSLVHGRKLEPGQIFEDRLGNKKSTVYQYSRGARVIALNILNEMDMQV